MKDRSDETVEWDQDCLLSFFIVGVGRSGFKWKSSRLLCQY